MDCDREFSLNEHGTGSTAQEAEHELTSPPFVAGVSGSPRRPRECENFPVRQSTSLKQGQESVRATEGTMLLSDREFEVL